MSIVGMNLNREFGAAASKAFGLDPARVSRTEISPANQDTMDSAFAITFEILLTPPDLVRIGEIMGEGMVPVSDPGPQNEIGQREVQHVDTPDEEPAGIPPHVWLYRNMLTEQQAVAPLGRDETNGQYAVAVDQLTDEQQLIPHVYKQLSDDGVSTDANAKIEENEIVRRC